MPTIRALLDRYGQPPREVALDWGWQIRRHQDALTSQSTNCLLADRAWTEVEVSENGLLKLDELDSGAAHRALCDLRDWVGSDVTSADSRSAVLCRWGSSDTVSPDKTLPDPTGSIDALQLTESVDTVQSNKSTGTSLRSPAARSARHSARHRTNWSTIRFFADKKLATIIGVAVIGVLLLVAAFRLGTPSPRQNAVAVQAREANTEHSDTTAAIDSVQLDTSSLTIPEPQVFSDGSHASATGLSLGQLNVDASLAALDKVTPTISDVAEGMNEANDLEPTSPGVGDTAEGAVERMLKQASAEESVEVTKPSRDGVARGTDKSVHGTTTNGTSTNSRDASGLGSGLDTHGDPWVLTRETMRYRVSLSPQLNVNARQSQWTLALEPIAGLVVEPQRPITLTSQGLAVWRIYEADAKPPRACLFVRARHLGREGKLELVFCGGAEDLPGMPVPLAQRWLEPLTVRAQSQALELRGALNRLSTTVITRDQLPATLQHKQALISQMAFCARLGSVMPEVNRLAGLVDGQVTMHAALKNKADEPPIATWGRVPE